MTRKISSSFTEFQKVFGILSFILFIIFFVLPLSEYLTFELSLMFAISIVWNLLFALTNWKMKEVEMTDTGLLISSRFFFKQKTIFVPYENVELLKLKLAFDNKTVSIKFTEPTEFGKKISFTSKGYTVNSRAKIVEELNQAIIQNKKAGRLNSAFSQCK